MIISRANAVLRLMNATKSLSNVRNMSGGAFMYRSGPLPHSKKTLFFSEAAGALMWWWILWHLWHEHEHITGEFPFPDASQWTDAELGIPSG